MTNDKPIAITTDTLKETLVKTEASIHLRPKANDSNDFFLACCISHKEFYDDLDTILKKHFGGRWGYLRKPNTNISYSDYSLKEGSRCGILMEVTNCDEYD